jgi:hypothetical protein
LVVVLSLQTVHPECLNDLNTAWSKRKQKDEGNISNAATATKKNKKSFQPSIQQIRTQEELDNAILVSF